MKLHKDEVELMSSCCSAHVSDLAGEGIGGIDRCPECGEWCEIIGVDENGEEVEKEKK